MFETYSFRLTQTRGVKSVMDDFTTFRPDDKTPAQVATVITNAETGLDNAESAWTDLNLARGTRDETAAAGHDAVVDVYAIMKRRYRKDPSSFDSISKLPVEDQTPVETLRRMKLVSKLWGKLPNPPDSATAFKAWDTMGKTEFDALITPLKDALEAEDETQEEWDKVNGELKELQAEMEDFVTTALNQGRAQYPEGTAERAAIEGIPTDGGSSATLPGVADLVIEDSGVGFASMTLNAPGAATVNVYRKLVGGVEGFILVGDGVPVGLFTDTGVPAGEYEYQGEGVNETGVGPMSNTAVITVS